MYFLCNTYTKNNKPRTTNLETSDSLKETVLVVAPELGRIKLSAAPYYGNKCNPHTECVVYFIIFMRYQPTITSTCMNIRFNPFLCFYTNIYTRVWSLFKRHHFDLSKLIVITGHCWEARSSSSVLTVMALFGRKELQLSDNTSTINQIGF